MSIGGTLIGGTAAAGGGSGGNITLVGGSGATSGVGGQVTITSGIGGGVTHIMLLMRKIPGYEVFLASFVSSDFKTLYIRLGKKQTFDWTCPYICNINTMDQSMQPTIKMGEYRCEFPDFWETKDGKKHEINKLCWLICSSLTSIGVKKEDGPSYDDLFMDGFWNDFLKESIDIHSVASVILE